MERDAFLAAVRRATGTTAVPDPGAGVDGPSVPSLPDTDLVELFIERLRAVDGIPHPVSTDAEGADTVARVFREHGIETFLSWDSGHIPTTGLLERLHEEGRSRLDAAVPADAAGRIGRQAGYLSVRGGLTGADGGLAESGSIIVTSGPGRPRMASLIPLVHVALLREDRIVRTFPHWIAAHPGASAVPSNMAVITGPSRTADIEQQLNLGVHGPKHLHVVVLPPAPRTQR